MVALGIALGWPLKVDQHFSSDGYFPENDPYLCPPAPAGAPLT